MKYVTRLSKYGDRARVYHLDENCIHLAKSLFTGVPATDEQLEEFKIKKVCKTCLKNAKK